MRAVELEFDTKAKKRVLRKGELAASSFLVSTCSFPTCVPSIALEYVPASIKLWKETVKLEDNPEDARILLARAVEVIPSSQELWLALARLESPENAPKVLNAARKVIPTSHEIWIAAGRLSEQEGKGAETVDMIISKAIAALKKNGAELSREQWLAEAEKVELQGSVLTSQAIIKATLHLDVEEEDRQDVWMEDALSMEAKGLLGGARSVYAYSLRVFPQKQSIWRKAAELEKAHGSRYALSPFFLPPLCALSLVLTYPHDINRESLLALLERAVTSVPHAEVLWVRCPHLLCQCYVS